MTKRVTSRLQVYTLLNAPEQPSRNNTASISDEDLTVFFHPTKDRTPLEQMALVRIFMSDGWKDQNIAKLLDSIGKANLADQFYAVLNTNEVSLGSYPITAHFEFDNYKSGEPYV